MRIAEARSAIAEAVSRTVERGFAADHSQLEYASRRVGRPSFCAGDNAAGHDASKVPEVPAAIVETCLVQPGERVLASFSYKVEYGDQPRFTMYVPKDWARRIAHPGWAVLGGRPVLDILESDQQQRPVRVRTTVIWANFDQSMHGWRAHADNVTCRVDWSDPEAVRLFPPLGEPDDATV
jgi:hypothetical protein